VIPERTEITSTDYYSAHSNILLTITSTSLPETTHGRKKGSGKGLIWILRGLVQEALTAVDVHVHSPHRDEGQEKALDENT